MSSNLDYIKYTHFDIYRTLYGSGIFIHVKNLNTTIDWFYLKSKQTFWIEENILKFSKKVKLVINI